VTFPAAPASTVAPDREATESVCAEALVRWLPGPALMAQRHAGPPIPATEFEVCLSATYVGARSADFALILLDQGELAAAGGVGRVQLGDVLRPALEQAAATIGGGMLSEVAEGASAPLFSSPDAVVFDLIGEAGVAGWFAVLVRDRPAGPPLRDVAAGLGRIKNVEMTLTVEVGRARVSVRELLAAQPGTVIELDRALGAKADVLVNGRLIAHGEIVVVDSQFAVRVTEVLESPDEA
jgi:flagellar motor switch protein FliN